MRRRPLPLVIIGITIFMSLQGCASVKIRHDPEIRALLFRETGYNLAYYTLRGEPIDVLDRTEDAIKTAIGMLETKDVGEMVALISEYIAEMPQFKTPINEYNEFAKSAIRLLRGVIEVNLELPEEYQPAVHALRHFLGGALEGIATLKPPADIGKRGV